MYIYIYIVLYEKQVVVDSPQKNQLLKTPKMPMKLTLGVHRMDGKDFRVACQRKQCGP